MKDRSFLALTALLVVLAGWSCFLPLTAVTPQESDGAELALMATTNGLLHPPGYPLYSLLSASLVSLYPANPYATLAVSSAVLQGLTGGILFLAAYLLCGNIIVSSCLSFAWLLFEPTMRTATDAEVFALHHALISLVVLGAVMLDRMTNPDRRSLALLGVATGLAGSHHPTSVLWAPLIAAVVLRSVYHRRNMTEVALSIVTFCASLVIGLSPYLLLVYRAYRPQAVQFFALERLGDVIPYILRTGYGTFRLGYMRNQATVSYLPLFVWQSLASQPLQLLSVPVLCCLAMKEKSAFLSGMALTLLLHVWFAHNLIGEADQQEMHAEWMIHFFALLAIATSISFAATLGRLGLRKWSVWVVVPLLIFPVAWHLRHNCRSADARTDRTVEAELDQVMKELPIGSVFVSSMGRLSMGMPYKRYAFGERGDIVVVITGMLSHRYYVRRLAEENLFLSALEPAAADLLGQIVRLSDQSGRKVFSLRDRDAPEGYLPIPTGITWQWVRAGTPIVADQVAARLLSYCAEWPDELDYRNPARRMAFYIKERVFFWPITSVVADFRAEGVRVALLQAVDLARSGNVREARRRCRQALADLGLPFLDGPRPYPTTAEIMGSSSLPAPDRQDKPRMLAGPVWINPIPPSHYPAPHGLRRSGLGLHPRSQGSGLPSHHCANWSAHRPRRVARVPNTAWTPSAPTQPLSTRSSIE